MNGLTMKFKDLARRIQPPEGLIPENWVRHPRGRGWVAKTATVASTAFVGPDAIVMEEARVLDTARIEGTALVAGNSLVAGESVVTDQARIDGAAKVLGKSRVTGDADIRGYAVLLNRTMRGGVLAPSSTRDRIRWRRVSLNATRTL